MKKRPGLKPGVTQLDLQSVWQQAQVRAQVQAEEHVAALARERAVQAQREVFTQTVGPVQALKPHGRAERELTKPQPMPRQRELDEQAVMLEAMSDGLDGEQWLQVDETLSFARPGLGPDVLRKLSRGHWSAQGELDLHGLRSDEARTRLAEFLRLSKTRGWRCIRVIHGKGLGSPGKTPILKSKVRHWLQQKQEVIAFSQAPIHQGGSGALLVLLDK